MQDYLTYNYKENSSGKRITNQLSYVEDTHDLINGLEGYPQNSSANNKFGYDDNGNMISDAVRNITSIDYDHR